MENTATQAFEELVAEQKRNVIASLDYYRTLYRYYRIFACLHYSNIIVATLAVRGAIPKLNKILSKPVSRNCKINSRYR